MRCSSSRRLREFSDFGAPRVAVTGGAWPRVNAFGFLVTFETPSAASQDDGPPVLLPRSPDCLALIRLRLSSKCMFRFSISTRRFSSICSFFAFTVTCLNRGGDVASTEALIDAILALSIAAQRA